MRSVLTGLNVTALFFAACSSPSSPMEYTLTSADSSFAELMADLHGADIQALEAMEDRVFLPDHSRQDSVLAAFGLTSATYAELVETYAKDPDRLVAVYNRALDVASGR